MTGPKYSANLFIASLDFKENQINTSLIDYHGALNGLVLLQDTYDFRQVTFNIKIDQ